jgi:hypothetical protein
MRNILKYLLSMKCTKDKLGTANIEIYVRVFGKDSNNNIVEISLIQINTVSVREIGTETYVSEKVTSALFNSCDNLKSGIGSGKKLTGALFGHIKACHTKLLTYKIQ